MPRFIRKAKSISTVSEYSKSDIVERYHISPDRIDVVFNASKTGFTPVSDLVQHQTKEKYSGGKNYFLFVGAIHPRKNVHRLLAAFDKFKKRTGSDFKLVIVGKRAWMTGEINVAYERMQYKADVVFTGYLSEAELIDVTASAYTSVFVSLFEGFGVPIVEAMTCGVPVITSNVSSMPEVAGDAALLVNPNSVDDICSAMERISSHAELRNQLIERGKVQASKFSWEQTASKLWETCERVLGENSRISHS